MQSTAARRWAALIDQAERSNLSNREFAARAGVNPNTLAWWKWRLGSTRRTAATRFIEVVEHEPIASTLSVELGEDVVITVDDHTDLALLRRVVDALCVQRQLPMPVPRQLLLPVRTMGVHPSSDSVGHVDSRESRSRFEKFRLGDPGSVTWRRLASSRARRARATGGARNERSLLPVAKSTGALRPSSPRSATSGPAPPGSRSSAWEDVGKRAPGPLHKRARERGRGGATLLESGRAISRARRRWSTVLTWSPAASARSGSSVRRTRG